MSNKKFTILIVTFNNKPFMKGLLDSIMNQTLQDFDVLVIDNQSQDGTVELIRNEYPTISVVANRKNLGFAGGNNQGINFSRTPYVLLCNPDILLEPNFLELMDKRITQHPEMGAFGGKLLKVKKIHDDEIFENKKTPFIDSIGLQVLKNRRFVEKGVGGRANEFNEQENVFGFSASLVLFKREALESIKVGQEYFDEDFFTYKEDVDLAWRLQHAGWKSFYAPEIIAYHFRTAADQGKEMTQWQVFANRKRKSQFISYHSYKNHLYLLLKNEHWNNFWRHFPWIAFYELRKLIYVLLFEQKTLKSYFEFFKNFKKIRNKRKHIFAHSKMSAADFRKWTK